MSVLYNFADLYTGNDVEIVCYEKQTSWGGLWNLTWRTGRFILLPLNRLKQSLGDNHCMVYDAGLVENDSDEIYLYIVEYF